MRQYLTLTEACRVASLSRNTLKKYIIAGEVQATKIGTRGDWRVDAESLKTWLSSDYQAQALEILRSLG